MTGWFDFFLAVLQLWFWSNFPAGLELSHGVHSGCLKHDMIDNEVFYWLFVCGVYYVYEDLEVMTYSIAGMSREDGWTRGPSHVRCWPSCKGQGQGALVNTTPPLIQSVNWNISGFPLKIFTSFLGLYQPSHKNLLNAIVKVRSLKIKVRQVFHFFQKQSWFFSWCCGY